MTLMNRRVLNSCLAFFFIFALKPATLNACKDSKSRIKRVVSLGRPPITGRVKNDDFLRLSRNGSLVIKAPPELKSYSVTQANTLFQRYRVPGKKRWLHKVGFESAQALDDQKSLVLDSELKEFLPEFSQLNRIAQNIFPSDLAIVPASFYMAFETGGQRAHHFHLDDAFATLLFQFYGKPETGTEYLDPLAIKNHTSVWDRLFSLPLGHIDSGRFQPDGIYADKTGIRFTSGGSEVLVVLGRKAQNLAGLELSPGYHRGALRLLSEKRIVGALFLDRVKQ
jgi:hypothetical protein